MIFVPHAGDALPKIMPEVSHIPVMKSPVQLPSTQVCLEGFQCGGGSVKFGICPSSPSQKRAQMPPKHCRCL